jgi:hypothetical protein
VPEAERPNGRVAEGRGAYSRRSSCSALGDGTESRNIKISSVLLPQKSKNPDQTGASTCASETILFLYAYSSFSTYVQSV